jgi:hypothetical protein
MPPNCQVVDPSGAEDFRRVYPVRQDLFEVIDDLLLKPTEYKYSLILGDTGMGKTSFLLNYYARHWQSSRRKRDFPIRLIPLGRSTADDDIQSTLNKSETVLFLDAFDEDPRAERNHRPRLLHLLEASAKFRHVIVTCRTQFFAKDDEIPPDAGVLRVGKIDAPRVYALNKLYISPFSDEQIRKYVRRRFPLWQIKKRRSALEILEKIEDLAARPMLLAQIDHILSLGKECKYPFQVYEQMIQYWTNREKGLAEPLPLREFCECLAVDIFLKRRQRGAERITEDELAAFAKDYELQLPKIEHIRSRSLLNRDAQGNLKFSHRSIMEYLFVSRFRKVPFECPQVEWTEQMKKFYWETSLGAWESDRAQMTPQPQADLSGLERLRIKPIVSLRNQKQTMTPREEQRSFLEKENRARVERSPHFYRKIDFLADLRKSGGIQMAEDGAVEAMFSERSIIVADHALGLAWELPGQPRPETKEDAERRPALLNKLRPGSFAEWRLPTTEEAYSLAHIARVAEYRTYFQGLGQRVWTADTLGIQPISVNLSTGQTSVERFSLMAGNGPRAVCVTSIS